MSLAKKVFSFSFFTMISRLFGYFRDVVLANKLGTSLLNDAFIVAFRLPNMFRAIFAEGALNNAFVPIYSSEINAKKQSVFAANVRNLLFIALLLLTILAEIFMPYIVRFMAPGLIDDGNAIQNATLFSRITFIYIMMISLTAFYGSIMNARGKFIPFASAPILLNLCVIAFLWKGNLFENNGKAAAFGICAAGFAQFVWIMFFMRLYKIKLPVGSLKVLQQTKVMVKRMLPIIIAAGFVQINFLIDNVFASLETGAISYLYYANRLMQLPLSVIGISLGVVTLPALAKYFKENVMRAIAVQNRAFIFAIYFCIPAAFALFFLSHDIIGLLLERGAFNELSTHKTAIALGAYAVGLPAWILQKIMLSNYHSRGDTSYPLRVSIITILLNLALNALLFYLIGFVGVALASSIAIYANLGLLFTRALKLGFVKIERRLLAIFLKATLCSILMVFCVKMLLMNWEIKPALGPIKIILASMLGFILYVVSTISVGVKVWR